MGCTGEQGQLEPCKSAVYRGMPHTSDQGELCTPQYGIEVKVGDIKGLFELLLVGRVEPVDPCFRHCAFWMLSDEHSAMFFVEGKSVVTGGMPTTSF